MEMTIFLSDLHFYAFHGVMEQERKVGNEFIVDAEVVISYSENDISDNLESTVSYADIYEIIDQEMKSASDLLETVALRIRKRLLRAWPRIMAGFIKITKTSPPIAGMQGSAGVKLKFY